MQAQTKSLEQDSGYLGSPATEHHLAAATGVTSPPLGEAKRELASLLRDQEESRRGRDEGELKGSREEREKEDFFRSNSLPSFPESFQVPSLLSHTSKGDLPADRCPPQEELDDLDLEIEAIVGLRDGGSGKLMPSSQASTTVQLTPDCLKPRPLRTSAVMISPGGPVMLSPMLAGGGGSTPLVMVNTVSTAVTSESVSQVGGVSQGQGGLSQGGLGLELGLEGGGTAVLGTVELLPVQASSSWAQPPPGYKKASQFTGE